MSMIFNKVKELSFFVLVLCTITLMPVQTVISAEVESDVCLECHDYVKTLSNSEHAIGRMISNGEKNISCESCHPDASLHVEDPSTENIGNPTSMNSIDVQKTCESCHVAHNNASNIGYATHSTMEVSCVDCHVVHNTKTALKKSMLCLSCHNDVVDDMKSRTHHPFIEGNIECTDCHNGYSKEQLDQSFNAYNCKQCHVKQSNPHLYEHEAVMGYSVEGDGCESCHNAHGSEHNYLLSQPSNQLCEQCHFPANHLTAHSGNFATQSCVVCHSEIHGSNYNRYFLDKSMPAKFGSNCYETGCHTLIE